ncbi:MAG: 2-amino-4-hydroxy-6-hydroxymethyldihydropteridine diphosphokinase, partial [Gammaproteobacteria bacterium]
MRDGEVRAWIGLGTNMGDLVANLADAVRRIEGLPGVRLHARSSLYRTEPWGVTDQPAFLNAVVAVTTRLEPVALLRGMLGIERDMGRRRDGPRWGPRLIDLDLLLFGDREEHGAHLQLPHPRLHERRFVLEPLAELAPDLAVPGRGMVSELLRQLDEPTP